MLLYVLFSHGIILYCASPRLFPSSEPPDRQIVIYTARIYSMLILYRYVTDSIYAFQVSLIDMSCVCRSTYASLGWYQHQHRSPQFSLVIHMCLLADINHV